MKKEKTKLPNCWICEDIGLVFYNKISNGLEYEMAVRCICRAGLKYSDMIAQVTEQVAEWSAKANFEKWAEKYPEDAKELIEEKQVV